MCGTRSCLNGILVYNYGRLFPWRFRCQNQILIPEIIVAPINTDASNSASVVVPNVNISTGVGLRCRRQLHDTLER